MIATQTPDVNSLGTARLTAKQPVKQGTHKAPGKIALSAAYILGTKPTIAQLNGSRKNDPEITPISRDHRALTPRQRADAPDIPVVITQLNLGNTPDKNEIRNRPPAQKYSQRVSTPMLLTYLSRALNEFREPMKAPLTSYANSQLILNKG